MQIVLEIVNIYVDDYTYDNYSKTFNSNPDGPRWIASFTVGNTVGLDQNEIVPSYLWIKNDHSSNKYMTYFSIGYKNSYVSIDNIYYSSWSSVSPEINHNLVYRSDGTIDSVIKFGDPNTYDGELKPNETLNVYIDWKYKNSSDDW